MSQIDRIGHHVHEREIARHVNIAALKHAQRLSPHETGRHKMLERGIVEVGEMRAIVAEVA